MKLFKCTHCGQVLYFENSICEQCGYVLGFSDETLELTPIVDFQNDNYKIYGDTSGKRYRYCKNNEYNVCNWLVSVKDESAFCTACKLNRTIPNISKIDYRQQW